MDYETIEYQIEERIVEAYWRDGVWLAQRGLSALYIKPQPNIARSIRKIQASHGNELTKDESDSVHINLIYTDVLAKDGKRYRTTLYGESFLASLD